MTLENKSCAYILLAKCKFWKKDLKKAEIIDLVEVHATMKFKGYVVLYEQWYKFMQYRKIDRPNH
jgi:hypothetical protein